MSRYLGCNGRPPAPDSGPAPDPDPGISRLWPELDGEPLADTLEDDRDLLARREEIARSQRPFGTTPPGV